MFPRRADELPELDGTEPTLLVEDGVPKATVGGLRKLGHETVRPARPIGGG